MGRKLHVQTYPRAKKDEQDGGHQVVHTSQPKQCCLALVVVPQGRYCCSCDGGTGGEGGALTWHHGCSMPRVGILGDDDDETCAL